MLALAASGALALGATACGSSNKSSTSSGGSTGSASTSASTSTSTNASSSGVASGTVSGAGSTFAAPVYMQWGSELKSQGLTVNYQAVGSGAGVAAWTAGTANFAGNDSSLAPADIAAAKKGKAVQIPMFFGAITVSYNLSGVKAGLKLDGPTVANIFLGKIKTWNDAAIKALNPGITLPSANITIVHRSDSSGTTKGFTKFLSAVSPTWASKIGADKVVKWPTGTGAKGNAGVAAAVKQTAGSVGYVEEAYALQNNFTTASVKNSAGKFVAPTLASTSAAGEGLKIPADLGISAINAPNPAAYPIASQTFIDVYQDLCKGGLDQGTAKALASFLNFGLGKGSDELAQLYYAKLPAPILAKAQAAVSGLQCNGSPAAG
ncbi:MAG: pstS [Solirubrobacterales bacterium]|nr:pstS [Solirubrobacterales bacterium]